jgi:hypothetical protein
MFKVAPPVILRNTSATSAGFRPANAVTVIHFKVTDFDSASLFHKREYWMFLSFVEFNFSMT